MKNKAQWTVSPLDNQQYIGTLEFKDLKGKWHNFEVIRSDNRLVFAGCANACFIESGYLEMDCDCETQDGALSELLSDLETFYNDGAQYVSRIVFNERM